MLGLSVKVVGKTRTEILESLRQVVISLQGGDTNAFIPLNDEAGTEADYSVCQVGNLGVFDDWASCTVVDSFSAEEE